MTKLTPPTGLPLCQEKQVIRKRASLSDYTSDLLSNK